MYTFNSTEQNNEVASEYETKSLLYLLTMRKDSSEMDIFVIDCFNDVTGGTKKLDKMWDVQSKGVKSLNPTKIGTALITLFQNYISQIKFNHFILFIPKLKEGFLNDEDLSIYNINNFKSTKISYLENGLFKEFLRREKISILSQTILQNIKLFFNELIFVVAEPEKENYVKGIIDFKNKSLKSKEFFVSVFNDIRDMQTVLKTDCINGVTITDSVDVLKYKKIIKRSDIEILIINRLIGVDVFNYRGIPLTFVKEVKLLDDEDIKDIMQHCKTSISRTMFNKNNKKHFWRLLELVVQTIKSNPNESPRKIYEIIPIVSIKKVHTLDEISTIYFIALIMEGLTGEN